MSRLTFQVLIGWMASVVAICSGCIGAPKEAEGLRVVVTIPPLKGIIEPLLPEGSTVKALMPPGRSEHHYEFTPADMVSVGGADLVLYVGMGLEAQLEKFLESHESKRRVDIGLADCFEVDTDDDGQHGHAEGEAHDHGHGMGDPHVWLDPILVRDALPRLAEGVRVAMEARGEWNEAAKQRLQSALEAELARVAELDGAFREQLAPFKGDKVVTHHAAFGRLAARYGIVVAEVIRVNEGEEPSPGRIAAVVQAVRKEGVRVIFVEPQFDPATARRVAKAAGVQVVTLDPLGDGDWFAMMRGNLDSLVKGMSAKKDESK
ncbi:MAG: zinc ABC transporter substrate-binding protein [Phycisphaeraceae bacterium]|nr:zinc ABC transporter substrate-binding protein [Phycisphaeraceae bacterium]